MRISDWSSDGCSSDLASRRFVQHSAKQGEGDSMRIWLLAALALSAWVPAPLAAEAPSAATTAANAAAAAALPFGDTDHFTLARRGLVDRKNVLEGKRVYVRVDLGGRRIINKKT